MAALTEHARDRLAGILCMLSIWSTTQGRVDFINDVFFGSPRKVDLFGMLQLDGSDPRLVAGRVVDQLAAFGQDRPGHETLVMVAEKLLAHYVGGGPDSDFLRDLLEQLIREPPRTRIANIAEPARVDQPRLTAETKIVQITIESTEETAQILAMLFIKRSPDIGAAGIRRFELKHGINS